MVEGNYDRILEKISKASGISKSEIEKRVEDKRSKLSGLISREGAAQVIAGELGISFENEKLKLDELLPGMRKVNVVGKIINLFPIRTFKTKNGEESKVTNLWLADDSSNVKVVLWDTNHISLIEKGEIKESSVVEIFNGTMRDNELHLGSFSEFKLSQEVFSDVVTEKVFHEREISKFKQGESVGARAFVVQIFEPRFFSVCSECGKKAVQEGESFICQIHGKVIPEKRAILTVVLDDGTETIRAVLFQNALDQVGIVNLDNPEAWILQKESLLGKEMVFSGNIRNNNYFNNLELIVDSIKEVDLDSVIKKLEK